MNAFARSPLRLLAALAVALAVAPGGAEDPLARALAEQRQRAEATPYDARVQNDLGNLLALAGETAAAETAYRSALAADPDFATAHYNLGRLLSRQGHLWAARRELKRALHLEPANADAHYHLGVVYSGWGFDGLARRAYARAFRLDPSLADPQRNPHVLENRQALAAQLLAWKAERAPGPTRQYEDAESIASQARLAEPQESEEPVVSEPAASVDEAEAPTGGGFARATGAPGVEPRRVDAKPSEPSQATSPPRTPSQSRDRSDASAPAPAGAAPIVLGAGDLRSSGSVNQVRPSGGDRTRGSSGSRSRDASPSRFRPSRFSTSRIETGLELADPTRRAVGS